MKRRQRYSDIIAISKPETMSATIIPQSNALNNSSFTKLPGIDEDEDLQKKLVGYRGYEALEADTESDDSYLRLRVKFLKSLSSGTELDRWQKMMKFIHEDNEKEKRKLEIAAFRYSTDVSYMRRSRANQVWDAILRRSAWSQAPIKMTLMAVAQITLCAIVHITNNAPINVSTIVMAAIYVSGLIAANPLEVSQDLIGYIKKFQKKSKLPQSVFILILVAASPVLLFLFIVTLLLDIMIGEILDISFGSVVNILVNVIVVNTAISVGLRSGNPVSAIQTFAGFDFISNMDEMVMEGLDIDVNLLTDDKKIYADNSKILTSRLTIYILTPIIVGFNAYLTLTDKCAIFCSDLTDYQIVDHLDSGN